MSDDDDKRRRPENRRRARSDKRRGGENVRPRRGGQSESEQLRAIEEALERIDRVAQGILDRTLLGQKPIAPVGRVPLEIDVALRRGDPRERAGALLRSLRRRVEAVGDGAVALRPGRIYCFRSRTNAAEYCVPASPREVFIGYDPTGRPRFNDFADLALARGDDRIEDLYRDPPMPITIFDRGSDLRADQLPVFGRGSTVFRILGQVAIGYLPFGGSAASDRPVLSLTVQVVETKRRDGRSQLDLNVIGCPPQGSLESWLFEAFDGALLRAVRQTRQRVRELGRRGRGRIDAKIEDAVEPMLRQLARSIERFCRQGERRTGHSRDRRKQRDRPTQKAFADAAEADLDSLFRDEENNTFIVVGPRGRTHVFSVEGRHVTSINYSRDAIARKLRFKLWRELSADEVDRFRAFLNR